MILIIKHIEIEGPGTLEKFFQETGRKIKSIELGKGDRLPALDECEAVISLGGPMNVYEEDKYPFLRDEDKFLRQAIKTEIPILGICLGAQLLAKACGARIKKADKREIGWYKVNLTDEGKNDSLCESLPSQLSVFEWHEDTFDIPKGGVLLAESGFCPNQLFKSGKNAYGMQFHIEVMPDMVKSWIKEYTKQEKPVELDIDKMLIETYKRKEAFERQANLIYLNFARIIEVSLPA